MATSIILSPRVLNFRNTRSISSSPCTTTSSASGSPTSSTLTPFGSAYIVMSPLSSTGELVPKVEEVEDEDTAEDMKRDAATTEEHGPEPETPTSATAVIRRPRGRPRKYPPLPTKILEKPPKGRSKTGCLTCRRRKKKCDETKPFCQHCQKNNVHCEGYQPKEYWRPGRPQGKLRRVSETPRELPHLIAGIENEIDWFFLEHFNRTVSRVLSLFTDRQNPFKEILLPMALEHVGLMHSLLCLSGTHLVRTERKPDFVERQLHHFGRAIETARVDENISKISAGDEDARVEDGTVAQTLALCLNSICAGDTDGEYRCHLNAANTLIKRQPSANQEFQTFLQEFILYHSVSNGITSTRPSIFMMDNFELPAFVICPEEGMFLGVVDGLFGCLSKIRQLRDRIRARRAANLKPIVDYEILSEAQDIDAALRAWQCQQPADSSRWAAAMLYRQCTWLYLHRTILPSKPNEQLSAGVEEALHYLRQLPHDSSVQSILLMPLFVLGCATFDPAHRPEIRQALDALEAYSNFGNIDKSHLIVEEVWRLMDKGDEKSWDWERVMQEMGWDFLVT